MDLHEAQTIGLEMMAKHGLLAKGWQFEWFPAKSYFGMCVPAGKYRRGKRIVLKPYDSIKMSTHLTHLNPESEFRATMLHEISHALAGAKHGHDAHWRRIAKSIGDTGERCYGDHVVRPSARWTAICRKCDNTSTRHRRPLNCNTCPCIGSFNADWALVWTDSKTGWSGQIHPKDGSRPFNRYPVKSDAAA